MVINGRDPAALEQAREALAADRATAVGVAFDVDGPGRRRRRCRPVEEVAGPIDILVNNAGMQHRASFVEFADADWHRSLPPT